MRFTVATNDSLMKNTLLSRIAITLSLALLVGAPFAVRADEAQKPASNTTDGADRSARREKIHAWLLKKFDTNHNGKLDPDEREAMKKAFQERRGKGGGFGRGDRKAGKPGSDEPAAQAAKQ